MGRVVNPEDPTAYPRRRLRAEQTRSRVLDAAAALFIERGYVATTVEAIAARADVAPETVYSRFGNKRTLLATVIDVSIAGNQPLLEQEWVRAMREEADPHERVRTLARQGRGILERRHALDEVIRGAATSDPDLAALRDRNNAQRRAGQRELLAIVAGSRGLRPELDLEAAADILYAIGSPDTYRLLVLDRGWSAARFEGWYADAIERLLLDP